MLVFGKTIGPGLILALPAITAIPGAIAAVVVGRRQNRAAHQ